jgi:hypothetical protein
MKNTAGPAVRLSNARAATGSAVHRSTIVAPGQSCFDAYPRLSVLVEFGALARGALPFKQSWWSFIADAMRPRNGDMRSGDLVESTSRERACPSSHGGRQSLLLGLSQFLGACSDPVGLP